MQRSGMLHLSDEGKFKVKNHISELSIFVFVETFYLLNWDYYFFI